MKARQECIRPSAGKDTVHSSYNEMMSIYIRTMYFSHWKSPGVSERMWSENLDGLMSGEYQTLRGHLGRPSE